MAKQRTTFAKLQRERAKAAKKAEKQAARINGGSAPAPEPEIEELPEIELDLESMTTVERLFAGKGRLSAPELMAMTEKIQRPSMSPSIVTPRAVPCAPTCVAASSETHSPTWCRYMAIARFALIKPISASAP